MVNVAPVAPRTAIPAADRQPWARMKAVARAVFESADRMNRKAQLLNYHPDVLAAILLIAKTAWGVVKAVDDNARNRRATAEVVWVLSRAIKQKLWQLIDRGPAALRPAFTDLVVAFDDLHRLAEAAR
jgi:hypothetical protein